MVRSGRQTAGGKADPTPQSIAILASLHHSVLVHLRYKVPSMPFHLLDLPLELIIRTLSNLPMSDLATCRRANHFLHSLIEESTELQYLIELELSGMESNPFSTISIYDRLCRLKSENERWTTLVFSRRAFVATEPSPDLFEFSSGIYLHLKRGGKAIRYVQVPSS